MDQTSASTSEPKPVEVVDDTPKDSKEREETEEVAVAGTKRPSEAATEENKASNKKRESSSRDVDAPEAKPFGGRILTDEADVFEQNAWYDSDPGFRDPYCTSPFQELTKNVICFCFNRDHAPWGEEQEQHALKEIARQNLDPVPQELIGTYHAEAAENWNKFYSKNENRFFKDRHWLRIEFPELFQMVEADVKILFFLFRMCRVFLSFDFD